MSTPTTTDSADFYALEGLLDDDEQEYLHHRQDARNRRMRAGIARW
jgi:hypothetical protein